MQSLQGCTSLKNEQHRRTKNSINKQGGKHVVMTVTESAGSLSVPTCLRKLDIQRQPKKIKSHLIVVIFKDRLIWKTSLTTVRKRAKDLKYSSFTWWHSVYKAPREEAKIWSHYFLIFNQTTLMWFYDWEMVLSYRVEFRVEKKKDCFLSWTHKTLRCDE